MRAKPIYLNLFNFAFPITAIVSILHRLSGIFLFLAIPIFLSMLQSTLYYLQAPYSLCGRLIIWLVLSALVYHLCAGVRHLCMDVGWGENKMIARVTSFLVLGCSVFFSVIIWLRLC